MSMFGELVGEGLLGSWISITPRLHIFPFPVPNVFVLRATLSPSPVYFYMHILGCSFREAFISIARGAVISLFLLFLSSSYSQPAPAQADSTCLKKNSLEKNPFHPISNFANFTVEKLSAHL